MADAPTKTNIRDKGLLATLRDINELRNQSADIGNAFFNKSTEHNGPSDAMRHVIFNAKLTAGTGSRIIPWLLDKIHEYGESAIPIPGIRQPNREMNMDLANGELGREIGKLGLSDAEMVDLAQRAVQGGKAVTLSQKEQQQAYAEGGSVHLPMESGMQPDVKLQHAMEQPYAEGNVVGYAEGGKVSKRLAHISGVKSELPGVIREIATAAQLQHQPLAVSGLLAPADETPFGEMPALSAQELAARGTATVPTVGMSNVGLRGANVGRTVPYYAGKGLQAEGWDITPEMVKEYQKAGINKFVTGKGGNYEVVVGHEGSHDTFPSEEENRRFTYERYAGSPEGAVAEAQYRVTDPHNPAFIEAVRAAYPRIGNPKYGEVSRTLEEYKKAQPVKKEVTIGLVAPSADMEYDPTRVQSIADQLRQEMYNA